MARTAAADPPTDDWGLQFADGHQLWSWPTQAGAQHASRSRDAVVIHREWTCTITPCPANQPGATT